MQAYMLLSFFSKLVSRNCMRVACAVSLPEQSFIVIGHPTNQLTERLRGLTTKQRTKPIWTSQGTQVKADRTSLCLRSRLASSLLNMQTTAHLSSDQWAPIIEIYRVREISRNFPSYSAQLDGTIWIAWQEVQWMYVRRLQRQLKWCKMTYRLSSLCPQARSLIVKLP